MANIVIPKGWRIPEQEATSEDVYVNRRKFLKAAGAVGAAGMLVGCGSERVFEPFEPEPVTPDPDKEEEEEEEEEIKPAYPAQKNPTFSELDRNLTDEAIAGGYNNYYEFSRGKTGIEEKAENFVTNPWTLEVKGLVGNPLTLDYDGISRRFPLEERLYRLRCVEAWSMAVPWTGFSDEGADRRRGTPVRRHPREVQYVHQPGPGARTVRQPPVAVALPGGVEDG